MLLPMIDDILDFKKVKCTHPRAAFALVAPVNGDKKLIDLKIVADVGSCSAEMRVIVLHGWRFMPLQNEIAANSILVQVDF